jgi:phosphocarrier protein HPr
MKSIQITVENKVGLHARPATVFVQTAQKHKATINVSYNGKIVNAKSLLGLLSLGAAKDAVITIAADGSDEEDALNSLTALVDSNFGE